MVPELQPPKLMSVDDETCRSAASACSRTAVVSGSSAPWLCPETRESRPIFLVSPHETAKFSDPVSGRYTIGMITMEVTTMHWVGFSPLKSSDFVPFGQVNFDPAAVTVRVDAPYKDVKNFIEAVKAAPGKYKSSGGGAGAVSHIAIAGLMKAIGLAPTAAPWVTMDSAATAQQELVAEGIEVVGSSLGETRALTEAGKVKQLAVMADERLRGFDSVPTVKESSGIDWSYATCAGLVQPRLCRSLEQWPFEGAGLKRRQPSLRADDDLLVTLYLEMILVPHGVG